jgi:peptide/nickel transport system permease protein
MVQVKEVLIRALRKSVYDPLKIILRSKRGAVGFAIVLFFALMATVGSLIVRYDPSTVNLSEALQPPSLKHPLGTDWFGRDILAMLIIGSQDVLFVSFVAALITTSVATFMGIISGYMGGKADSILVGVTDIVLTIPGFPLLIVIASILRTSNPVLLAAILSITAWAPLSRAIRAQTLTLRERGFIEMAKCLGMPSIHIITNEILPNIMPYIIINGIFAFTGAIYAQVGLFMLGLAPYKSQNWGVMLNLSVNYAGAVFSIKQASLLAPAICIILLQIGLVFLSGSLEEVFNPRLRSG